MSTATEIAKAEADEAEAAEEEEPTPQPPPPDNGDEKEPEPEAPPTDKVAKALDAEGKRHEATVAKLLGDGFHDYFRCPVCVFSPHGFARPLEALPEDELDTVRELTAMYLYGDEGALARFQPAADLAMCDVCQGEGLVRSGSKHPEHVLEICNPCLGNGWKRHEIAAPAQTFAPASLAPSVPMVPAPFQDYNGGPTWAAPDMAGRKYGDPDYGRPAPQPLQAVT